MRRPFLTLCLAASALAAGCADELVADVPPEVCYSGKQWVGGKRGHPTMYPGRDCVGCHLENDGPPLAIGGTLYPYVIGGMQIQQFQSGVDCFGIEGIPIRITDGDDNVYDLITNESGNFFIEGNPDDFPKPFTAQIFTVDDDGNPLEPQMFTAPTYGGCARCHDPLAQPSDPPVFPPDPEARVITARIGLPGYRDDEVRALVASPAEAPPIE